MEFEFIKGRSYHVLLSLIMGIMLVGVSLDFMIEYNLGRFSDLAIRDAIMFAIIAMAYILYIAKVLHYQTAFMISIYTIIMAITLSVFIRIKYPDFNFEVYYIRVELILILLSFTIGVFVQPWHKLAIAIYNLLFTVVCAFLVPDFGLPKFVFYSLLVTASGISGFVAFRNVIALNEQIRENGQTLEKVNHQLKGLNDFKDNLFKIIGHDLRSPVFQISSLLELLEHAETPTERKEYITYMKTATDNAGQLLNDILSWAKQNDGKEFKGLSPENFGLRDMVKRTMVFFSTNIDRKNLSIKYTIDQQHMVYFDPKAFDTLVRNLISNAIKFSPQGEEIRISGSIEGGFSKLTIHNKGNKIPSSLLKDMEAIKPVESSMGTANEKGSGHGLSICKKLLEQSNGNLQIENTADGVRAIITLPLYPKLAS